MASAGGSGIPAPGELPGYTPPGEAPWGGGRSPEYSQEDPMLVANSVGGQGQGDQERPTSVLGQLVHYIKRYFSLTNLFTASSTTSSSGNVYMVEALDPLINRVVVVTAETPQNVEPLYLDNLKEIARIQRKLKKYQNPTFTQIIQGHLSDHLPSLVDPPKHKIYGPDEPLRSLLVYEASRPAKAMIEVLIPASPYTSVDEMFSVPVEDENGDSYMTNSGRSIFQLPEGYNPSQDEQYRGMFCSWLETRNEVRGNELGTWEPTEETNLWIFQALDAETAWPIHLVLEGNGTYLGPIERWWLAIPNLLKSEFHEAVETAFICMTMSVRRNPGPAYPENPTGYEESLLLPDRFPEKIASIPTPANPFPSLNDYLETNHGRKRTEELADKNLLPIPSDTDIVPLPPTTFTYEAPRVPGVFESPVYFGEIERRRNIYRRNPQGYQRACGRSFTEPVSRAPIGGPGVPAKQNYVPPEPDTWVSYAYIQSQRGNGNQQATPEYQARQTPPQQQLDQQPRRASQESYEDQSPRVVHRPRRSLASQESKHSQSSNELPFYDARQRQGSLKSASSDEYHSAASN